MGIVGAAISAIAAVIRAMRGVQAPASGNIASFLSQPPHERAGRPVVVCLGAGIVRGRASVDFVRMLRAEHVDLAFVNGGVNSRVVWEMLHDLDEVAACAPAYAIIFVGTDDVQATLSKRNLAATRRLKGLPRNPSPEWFGECLGTAINRLHGTGARVAVCSLPPLGQDLDSPANDAVRDFNAVIREVVDARDATYLPVHETMAGVIVATGRERGPAYTGSVRPGLQSLVGHFALGRSYDDIAHRRGLLLSPDGVHLDTAGARIVANLVSEFLMVRGRPTRG